MSEYGYESLQAETEAKRAPGAVAMLADQVQRLHHQIGLLEDHLAPVLRDGGIDGPIEAVPNVYTEIEKGVNAVGEAVDRLIRLRDRLAV